MSTRDLYLAATLVYLKFYLCKIDYSVEGNKNQEVGYFCFEDTPELQEAKSKFTQGLLSVEPRQFMTTVKALKSEISNILQNPHYGSEK